MSGTQINLDQLGTVFVQGDRTRHVMVEEASFFALVRAVKAAQELIWQSWVEYEIVCVTDESHGSLVAALEPFSTMVEVPVGYPSPCIEACWTKVACPRCYRDMAPRGRSVSLFFDECVRQECPRHDLSANPRHLWTETDEERWRFWNEDGTPNVEAVERMAGMKEIQHDL